MGDFFMAGGAVIDAQAQHKASQYNAALARQNAVFTRQQSQEDARLANIEGRKVLGDMRSTYAISGVTVEGSAFDVLQESALAAKRDERNILIKGERDARMQEAGATLTEYEGKMARASGYLKAIGHTGQGLTKIATMGA